MEMIILLLILTNWFNSMNEYPDTTYSAVFFLPLMLSNLLILSVPDGRLSQSFDFERTWQKVIPIFWFWAYLTEGYSNLLILSVPDGRLFQSFDFERTWWKVIPIFWFLAYLTEGYSNLLILSVPDGRLFQSYDFERTWRKVIPEMCRAHYLMSMFHENFCHSVVSVVYHC